jgi:hypothetical protein
MVTSRLLLSKPLTCSPDNKYDKFTITQTRYFMTNTLLKEKHHFLQIACLTGTI